MPASWPAPGERPVNLTDGDIAEITRYIEQNTGTWTFQGSTMPGPALPEGGTQWGFACWQGPAAANPVPTIPITRYSGGYRITVADCMRLFRAGEFETFDEPDLDRTLGMLDLILCELRDRALNFPLQRDPQALDRLLWKLSMGLRRPHVEQRG